LVEDPNFGKRIWTSVNRIDYFGRSLLDFSWDIFNKMKLAYAGKNEEGEDIFIGTDKEWDEAEKLSDPQDNESRPKVEKALEELNELN